MATLSFGQVLRRLFANPLWAESLASMRAQLGIDRAWDAQVASGTPDPDRFVLAEEDWRVLVRAAEAPRSMVADGSGVVLGLGYHPAVSGQLTPFLVAIVEAVAS
jgi:hypothetical protein